MTTAGHAAVLVLGAGPAGLAAATTLARRGVPVVLVDRYDRPGGQIARQARTASSPSGPWAGLLAAGDHPRVRLLPGTGVVALQRLTSSERPDGVRAVLETRGRMHTIDARALVLATGAREVVAPFPGWTLPGVVTAGAVQALVKREGAVPWARIGLAGSGPLLLAVAGALRDAGQPPVFTLEAQPLVRLAAAGASTAAAFPGKSGQLAGMLVRHRPRFGWHVVEALGENTHDGPVLRAAVIARRDGRDRPGDRRTVAVDALAVSSALVPDVALALQLGCATRTSADGVATAVVVDADQRTSVPGVYAAGEVTGVGGAEKSVAEGRLAGEVLAAAVVGMAVDDDERVTAGQDGGSVGGGAGLRAEVQRWRRFADALETLYPFDGSWADRAPDDVLACRCEEVPVGAVRRAIADGAHTARAVKGLTRTGMGWCQGGVCSPVVRSLLLAAGHTDVGDLESRPLATPLTLSELARLAPPDA